MRIVLLGPPGAGKGTLAALLKRSLGIDHISTGDLLREQMKAGTELGREAKQYVEEGKLVPDDVITKLIEHKLAGFNTDQGYMLDGFPRTRQQAEDLDTILKQIKQPLDSVAYLNATLPVIIQRLGGRRVCKNCGSVFHIKNRPPKKENICDHCSHELYQRADDNEETIKTRMDIYLENTEPIIEYYNAQGNLTRLNGDEESEDLQEILKSILNNGK